MAISANVMNIETTESGTKVITLSLPDFCHTITVPENYINGLPVIAAQPYGVIMVEEGAADDMPVVCMNNNKEFFSIALSDLMAADVHDTISFATPYVFPENIDPSEYLAGLADVEITDPENGQALIYYSATGKWINGNVGGGDTGDPGYTPETTIYVPEQTVTLIYDEAEGYYYGALTNAIWFNGEPTIPYDAWINNIHQSTFFNVSNQSLGTFFNEDPPYSVEIRKDTNDNIIVVVYDAEEPVETITIKVSQSIVNQEDITNAFAQAVTQSLPFDVKPVNYYFDTTQADGPTNGFTLYNNIELTERAFLIQGNAALINGVNQGEIVMTLKPVSWIPFSNILYCIVQGQNGVELLKYTTTSI